MATDEVRVACLCCLLVVSCRCLLVALVALRVLLLLLGSRGSPKLLALTAPALADPQLSRDSGLEEAEGIEEAEGDS